MRIKKRKPLLNLRRKWQEQQRKRKSTEISSPNKVVRKKFCFANPSPNKPSPFRSSSSKRKRLTPASPLNFISPRKTPVKIPNIKRKLEFTQTKENTVIDETIHLFRKSVENGSFSTDNILFKLLQDSLKWHGCKNVSAMRYSEEVKQFFWTGRRLLGGQFLRFMRGYGHQGMIVQGAVTRGIYSPLDTEINLPVPSDIALREYRPEGIELSSSLAPGIIHENIDLYSDVAKTTSFVVMFDGKKIVPNSADVFLLGKEDEPKLADIQARFEEKVSRICNIVEMLEDVTTASSDGSNVEEIPSDSKKLLLSKCKCLLRDLADVSKSLRQTQAKKKTYLITLEKKFTETEDGKYKFAINKIRTLLYQISICLNDLLGEVDIILKCCAELNNTKNIFKVGGACVLEEQDNYMELKYPDKVRESCEIPPDEDIQPHLLKQRTPDWFQLRKSVKVTGSVMQRAAGLDTLASQREYFDTAIGGKEAPPINDMQKNAMDHGSKNELNAVATVVSKIAPVYYPGYTFYEEGAYVVKNSNGKDIVVVSPDGSLRCGSEKPVSLEIKCPCPQYAGVTPVFYNVKERHIVQSLAETHVLRAEEHLYVSWSKQSTTVFRMKSNNDLFNKVLDEVNGLYYVDVPKRPTRVTEEIKEIKAKVKDEISKAELLCEVPSVVATTKSTTRPNTNTPYYKAEKSASSTESVSDLQVTDVIQSLVKCKKTIMEAYNFQKPVASEVMIYLLSDMDRTWKQDIGHGLPVAFLYKGYSFPMTTSRGILECVLEACDAKDIHVPCVAFDGQFASLKDYDSHDNPLSLFAFHRQYWANVRKMSKKELIDAICMAYAIDNVDKNDDNVSRQNGKFVVGNTKTGQRPIKSHPDIIYKKIKISNEEELVAQVVDNTGLDEEVTDILQSVMPGGNLTINCESESVTREDTLLEDPDTTEVVDETETHESSPNTGSANPEIRLILDDHDFENMFQLCTLKGSKTFSMKYSGDLKGVFTSAERMDKELKGAVLHEILNYLNVKLTKLSISIKQSLRKAEKINKMCEVLGITSRLSGEIKVRKQKHVKTLKAMCITTLQKRFYPKEAIAVAYAEACWPLEELKWYNSPNSYVAKEICVTSENNDDIVFKPLYSPEYVQTTGQIQTRVMDGTHIRTNIKSKLIRTGLDSIKVKPWKDVALSGKTNLPLAMLEIHTDGKIMHQQSDPYVRTMFSKEVERELFNQGSETEANFCRLFREWHEAEDKPGLSARERVLRSLRLREWLLHGYNFGNFPPKTQYVKGIPRVTYEGLICSIDAHILLYAMCKGGTFNWRSVSTLVAENFMGELAERSQNNHGVPSGASLGADMTKISELHAMRLNPKRSFQMKTSKSRAYAVPELHDSSNAECTTSNTADDVNVQCHKISTVTLRNHVFDMRTPGKAKHGLVRKFGQQPRGVQSVRTHYKVDESKVLPSTALGLLEDMVEI